MVDKRCFLLFLLLISIGKNIFGEDISFRISTKGVPECSICINEYRFEQLKPLALELQYWLGEVIGQKPNIEIFKPEIKSIVIGTEKDFPDKAKEEKIDELGKEGFIIKTDIKNIWILANSDLGLSHGIYYFLEEIGCRWFFPDPVWTVIPNIPNLKVNLDIRRKPAFKWRNIWYGWGPRTPKLKEDYEKWMIRNRQYGEFRVNCNHAYSKYISPKEFEKHPEWFALVEDKRKPTQLCVSNPEVQKVVIERVLDFFRKNSDIIMAPLDPNDGPGHCECENCKSIGSISDRVFYFANKVAEGVMKEFPDKYIGLYAYAYHSEPPKFYLLPNIFVEVTTSFRYTNLTYEEQVKNFQKLGANTGVRDYFSVYPWDFDLPGVAKASRVYELANNIKNYSSLKMWSYTAEASCNWGPCGLGYWIASKLMWEPNLDPNLLVKDFCEKAFGRAYEPMRRLYERWARGERFSLRNLKLAFLDLKEAYEMENDINVKKRLNQIAMYLHFLKLWLEYDRIAKTNQWGKVITATKEEIMEKAKEVIIFARRIMDTGLIHTYPMLFSRWFDTRFAVLKKLEGVDQTKIEEWKDERKDVPTDEEIQKLFAEDLEQLKNVKVVEIMGKRYSEKLVPIYQKLPEAVKMWKDVKKSYICLESGEYYFLGKGGERLSLTLKPFDFRHTIDCNWSLKLVDRGELISQGYIKEEKGKSATIEIVLPEDGLYAFNPGTGYFKAAYIEFGNRPVSVWCGRYDIPNQPRRIPINLWKPVDNSLYFFVPKNIKHFVIGVVSGGDPYTDLTIETADGTIITKERVVSKDQISIIIDEDIKQYGEMSEMAKHAVLPSDDKSVFVPPDKKGQIWKLRISSLRCILEFYDIPPFVAFHPSELLVPEDAL